MLARRFERIALELMLSGCAVMFGACVLIEHAQRSQATCLLQRRCHRPFSIHPIPVLCLNRLTRPSRRQHQAQPLQHQAPFQVVRLDRV
jgi:hypothetical protein